ncbi:hypothetical protein [Legionella sp. km772]|uniref:hypothetical protein n=1 Tax=Legionella sp. km772 TaxID=2498111 RepID=UPI000F8EB1C3|nr:hypothetical protein [Legionella sp. km772]RUR13199.1 hypothetical protein ELY15_03035 [Legionella sp. km772]
MRLQSFASGTYLTLGILGACISLYGYLFQSQEPQVYYVLGSLALLATAIYYKLAYFIALELILIAGHLAILFGSGSHTQFTLPLLLCLQLIIVYSMLGQNNLMFLIIGILGIALLSIGLAYHNHWLFFFGSLSIALYAYYRGYRGQKASYLWAILNTIFALLALYHIFINRV